MSIRASLYANLSSRPKELAESRLWIPFCWLTLLSSNDLSTADESGVWLANRKEAIDRCRRSVPFLVELFPEFDLLETSANDLVAALKNSRAKTVALDFGDHLAIEPMLFPSALAATVMAVEKQDATCSFRRPAQEVSNPFTGKPMTTVEATTIELSRELLCLTAGTDPTAEDDEQVQRDKLIGYLLA